MMIFVLSLCLVNKGFAQEIETATQYKAFILAEKAKVLNKKVAYISKAHLSNGDKSSEGTREQVLEQIAISLEALKSLPTLEGDTRMKDEAIDLLKQYAEIYKKDAAAVDSIAQFRQDSPEQLQSYFEALAKIEKKIVSAGKKFAKAHESFDKKHNLVTANDKHTYEILNRMASVNSYSRKIYVPYFKLDKINHEFLQALKHKKVTEMNKKRENLLAASEEALTILAKVEAFEGDKEYLVKAFEIVNHFKNLSDVQYLTLTEIAIKKVLTQTESSSYNKIIIDSHKQTKRLTQRFNQASATLMQKNVFNLLHGNEEMIASLGEKKTSRDIIKASATMVGDEIAKSLNQSKKTADVVKSAANEKADPQQPKE